MSKTTISWTAAADESTGARKHTAQPADGVTITVWRAEPGSWRWEINGTPACFGAPSAARAKSEATAWFTREGRVRRCRVLHLGYRTTMLVRSGGCTDTAEEFAITREQPALKDVAPARPLMTVLVPRGEVTILQHADRIVMEGPSGTHSVLLDYDCGTGVLRDRALIHAAGFLQTNRASDGHIAQVLARLETVGAEGEAATPAVRRTIYTGVCYGLMRARITNGAEVGTAESMQGWEGRGRRIAQLVAWHVGIAGAPVIV